MLSLRRTFFVFSFDSVCACAHDQLIWWLRGLFWSRFEAGLSDLMVYRLGFWWWWLGSIDLVLRSQCGWSICCLYFSFCLFELDYRWILFAASLHFWIGWAYWLWIFFSSSCCRSTSNFCSENLLSLSSDSVGFFSAHVDSKSGGGLRPVGLIQLIFYCLNFESRSGSIFY